MTATFDPGEDIVVHRPDASTGEPAELVLMFHGVGADADDLEPLGHALAAAWPQAWIVSVRAPFAADLGRGRQWFSVREVTEANRPARVAAVMPGFVDTVTRWHAATGLDAKATTLLGFSQGGILALQSATAPTALSARVIAIATRFAQTPGQVCPDTAIHLMHGDADPVMPVRLAVEGEAALRALGATVTLDRFPGLGHGIDARVLARIVALGSPPTRRASVTL